MLSDAQLAIERFVEKRSINAALCCKLTWSAGPCVNMEAQIRTSKVYRVCLQLDPHSAMTSSEPTLPFVSSRSVAGLFLACLPPGRRNVGPRRWLGHSRHGDNVWLRVSCARLVACGKPKANECYGSASHGPSLSTNSSRRQ